MKPRILATARLSFPLASAIAALLAAPSLHAATIVWDANAGTAAQTDGAGAWLTASQWWNGATNVTFAGGDHAIFGNGGAGGAVTLASGTTVGSLTFNYFTGTYTLGTAGNTITLSSGITKNAGSGIVNFASDITLTADQTWTNNSATNLTNATGVRTLNNGGFNLTFSGDANTNFATSAGNTLAISGLGGIIKNGAGSLVLDSNPTVAHGFSGGITVNGGRVGFQTAANVTGRGNVTLNGGYLGGRTSSNATWSGLGTGATEIRITGGVSGFSGEGGSTSVFQIGTAGSTLQWGTTNFNPSALILGGLDGMNATAKGALWNAIDLNGSNRTITSLHTNGDGATTTGFSVFGAITNSTGTAGLIKTGAGAVILNNTNTYNGATSIQGGSIILSSVNTTAPVTAVVGTINSTSALNLSGGGTLRLVNTTNVSRLADGAAITSNGGGIDYINTASASVSYTETIGTLGLASGQTNLVLTNDQTLAGNQTLTINTGGITRTGAANSSAITFSAGGTGLNATKNRILVTGATPSGAGNIIGPWATVGTTANVQTTYAAYDASSFVVAASLTAAAVDTDLASPTGNYEINTGSLFTLAGTRTVNAVSFKGSASTLDLATFRLETNGLLFSGGTSNTKTITAGVGGALTTPSGGGNLYITTGQVMTAGNEHKINAPITNANGGGTVHLVKSGSGILILNGVNTFTGDIAINAGTLRIGTNATANGANLNGGSYAGNIFIGAGATLSVQSDANQILSGVISGDGNLTKAYTGTLTLSGDNTYTGKTSVAPISSQNAAALIVSSFNSVFTDVGLGTVHSASSSLGAPTTVANGTIDLGAGTQRTADLKYTGGGEITDRIINFVGNGNGATKTIDTSGTVNTLLKFTSAPTASSMGTNDITLQGSSNGEFVGGLPFAFRNFTKSGAGTWTLGGAVGSTGLITVNAGTLALKKRVSLQGGLESNWTAAKINVKSGATLALNVDSGDVNGLSANSLNTLLTAISVAGSSTAGLQSGAKLGLDTSTATGGTFTQGNLIANSTGGSGGAIHLTKLGTGTLVLDKANTYTGATLVNAGTLLINGDHTAATGAVTVASGATLGGTGQVGGNTTIQTGGFHAPGAPGDDVANQDFNGDLTYNSGSIFDWGLVTASNTYDSVTGTESGDLSGVAAVFNITSSTAYTDAFWNTNQQWTDIFSGFDTSADWDAIFTSISGTGLTWDGSQANAGAEGYFTLTASSLDWTAVPEPTSALVGLLIGAGLLRRRRN